MPARTHELGLFSAATRRDQPRDKRGRFVRVRYSPAWLAIFAAHPSLVPFGGDA